jgi:hypothetical protein
MTPRARALFGATAAGWCALAACGKDEDGASGAGGAASTSVTAGKAGPASGPGSTSGPSAGGGGTGAQGGGGGSGCNVLEGECGECIGSFCCLELQSCTSHPDCLDCLKGSQAPICRQQSVQKLVQGVVGCAQQSCPQCFAPPSAGGAGPGGAGPGGAGPGGGG